MFSFLRVIGLDIWNIPYLILPVLNRKAISIERDENYINTTIDRVKAMANGTLKIRKLGTKVYVPTGKEKVSKIPESWLNNESSK